MEPQERRLIASGSWGLDTILHGGLPAGHVYLVEGQSGTGKTTLAMQFLLEGLAREQTSLYISFSESQREMAEVAASHGWTLAGLKMRFLAQQFARRIESTDSIFYSSEVDLPEVIDRLDQAVDEVEPERLVVDPMTELWNVAENYRHFRRALFHLKAKLQGRGVTTLLVASTDTQRLFEADSIVHGIVELNRETPPYGPTRRRIHVSKFRGMTFEAGFHDFEIARGGLEIFPRLRPKAFRRTIGQREPLESGIDTLDRMLSGGLTRGTACLFAGPSGVGKSSTIVHYAIKVAQRGEHAVIYSFNEDIQAIKKRAESMQLPLAEHLESGAVHIEMIDAAEMSPGQFSHQIRSDVREKQTAFVAIDSINGYIHSMPSEESLEPYLHDLMSFLGGQGVILMFTMSWRGLLQEGQDAISDLSYLTDTILLFRYFEHDGLVKRSIVAIKNRTHDHDKAVRELTLGVGGVHIGGKLDLTGGMLGAGGQEPDDSSPYSDPEAGDGASRADME